MADNVGTIEVIYAFVKELGRYPTYTEAKRLARKYSSTKKLRNWVSRQSKSDYSKTPTAGLVKFLSPFAGANVWMLNVPELSKIVVKASVEGWNETRITGATQASKWWKTHNDVQKEWAGLAAADKDRLAEQTAYNLAEKWFDLYGEERSAESFIKDGSARKVASGNLIFEKWLGDQQDKAAGIAESPWAREIRNEEIAKGAFESEGENLTEKVWNTARQQFLLPFDKNAASTWAKKIQMNEASEAEFSEYARAQAAGLFPTFGKQIMSGVDPATLLNPYKNLASEELEREVDWHEKVLWDSLTSSEGTPTLSDFTRVVRSQNEWRATSKAANLAADLTTTLGQLFGKVS